MQHASAPCRDREILDSRYRADLEAYCDAVAKLESCAPHQSESAQAESEQARLALERARTALQSHVLAHGCGYI